MKEKKKRHDSLPRNLIFSIILLVLLMSFTLFNLPSRNRELILEQDQITTAGPVPVVNFTANATVALVNQPVQFTFTGDPGDAPSTFQWDFGDGSGNETIPNPIHTFTYVGSFNVTLTVVDNDTDTDTLVRDNFICVLDPLSDDDGDSFFNKKELLVGTNPLNTTHAPIAGNHYWNVSTGDWVMSSPAIGDVDGDGEVEVVFGSRDAYLRCVSGIDGILEWSFYLDDESDSSPVIVDVDGNGDLEIILASSYTPSNGYVYCLYGSNGTEKWSVPSTNYIHGTPAIGDVDDDGILEVIISFSTGSGQRTRCLSGNNGSEEWSYDTFNIWGSPVLADVDEDGISEVFVGSQNGMIYCLSGMNGSLVWNFTTGDEILSSPSLADLNGDGILEVVIASRDYKVYCISSIDGSHLWNYTTGNGIASSPTIADVDNDGELEILIGSDDNYMYCLSYNGTFEWSFLANQPVMSTPSAGDFDGDGKIEIIFGTHDNVIYCLSGENGSFEWSFGPVGDLTSSPTLGDVDGDGLLEMVIGSMDGNLYCLIGTGPSWAIPGPWPMFGGSATHGSLYTDTDGDGLTDNHELVIGTNITNNDTDGDGYDDSFEINSGTSPLNASDAPGLVPPVAAFTFQPTTPVEGQLVNLTDASFDPDGTIISHEWDFGDGSPNATTQHPSHLYNSSGNYTVTLAVTDNSNNTAFASKVITVEADLVPSANFTSNATTIIAGQAVQFTSTSTGGNAPLSCSWDFGDNSTNSSLQDPAHQYAVAGNYTVTLTITDRNGNSSTETKAGFIEVLADFQPVANFTANATNILEGDFVLFTYTGTAGNGNLSYQWDFGDGSGNSTLQDPLHQYATPGNYTVTVTVVDVDGDESTFALPTAIEVGPDLIPVTNFTASATTIVEREWINFTFTGSEGNAPASFQWDVGDGTPNYTAPAFSHQYVDSGTYTVTLTVTDDDGDANTTSIIDYIIVDKRPTTNGTVQHFDNGTHDVYLVDDQGTIWFEIPGLVVLSPVDVTLTLYLDINGELEGTYGIAAGFSIEFSDDGNVQLPATTIFHAWDVYFNEAPTPGNLSLYVADFESLSLVN
ncbi:MAG: PKD domain-containing protein, partial [Candidatus Hodarchaeota archaeon]